MPALALVPSEIIKKWQEIVDLLAEIMHVPSAVVMRVEPSNSEVFVSSHCKPSEAGSLYCETVMKTSQPLLVPDARRDERWKSSPDIKRGMVSYLGVPISWPNGEIFGTICVYDNKSNEYGQLYLRQLLLCRDVLQADLRTLATLHSQLEQHEAKIRRLVDTNIIGILIWDIEGRILEANDAFLRMGGYDREDLISGRLNRTNLTPPEWRERDARTDAGLKMFGAVQPFEKEYFRKDGGRVPVLIGLAAFGEERDQGIAFVLDLTERKRAEQALMRSEAYLAEAQKLTHTGSWVWDPRTEKVLYCSEEMFRIFGLDPRESLPSRDNFRQQIHPEDRDWVKKRFEESLRERVDTFAEYRVLLPDGTVRHINASGHPVLNEDGELIEFVGTAVDVTERKRAEVVGQRLAAIVNSSEDAIVSKDLNGTIETWNGGAERLFGYQASEVVGKSILIIIPPDRHGEELRIMERIRRGELIKSYETVRMREDGSLVDISLTVSPLRDAAGRIIGASKIARDITERKRAEAALGESEAKFRDYAESASDWYWETDPDHKFTRVTDYERLLARGFAPVSRIGRARWEFATDVESEPEKWELHRSMLGARQPFRDFVYRAVRSDGSPVYYKISGKPIYDAKGAFLGYRGTGTDVTAAMRAQQEHERLRQLESDLAHMNRLSMMGVLAASLAHEITQPIGAARNNARAALNFLDRQPAEVGEVREALGCIVDDADRAGNIIDRIRDHIKKAPQRKHRFDLNEAINEVIVLARSAIAENGVSVQTRLTEGPAPIEGDRVQLQQVILNLILNAAEAMRAVNEGVRELLISNEQSRTNGVLVAVRDSGPGINPEHIERIFDAFYTTKSSGMGMGLSICRSIIDAHGGRLWAAANEPRGAVFQFTLPPERDKTVPTERIGQVPVE